MVVWKPGESGNPAGRPKSIVNLERELREVESDHVLDVVAKLRELALKGDVFAAQLYLNRVLGPVRPAHDDAGTVAKTVIIRYETESAGTAAAAAPDVE